MALRTIRTNDDPILKKTSREVSVIDDKIKELLDDMFETMAVADGVGIAAVQVGILKRMVIVEIENDESGEFEPIEMINPEILEASEETQVCMEGCLSVPGYQGEVTRPKKVKVKWLDRDGIEHIEEFENLGAVVCCHEIDHLDGILYSDKSLNLERIPDEDEED